MAVGQLSPFMRHVYRAAAGGALSDGQLLQRYVESGDRAALAALVERHGAMVFGVCRRALGNVHDAEDAFQAVFLLLVHKASAIAQCESVGSWLHGVAYRTALKARRAAAVRRRARERQLAASTVAPAVPDILERELRAILDEEIARLPERYRLPVILCYLEGKTHAEAARLLGCPLGTVATQLARARARLRPRLERRGITLPVGVLTVLLVEQAPAAVPAALVLTTLQIAFSGAAGPAVTALTKGVFMTLTMTKVRLTTIMLLMLSLAGTGTGIVVHRRLAAADRDTTPTVTAAPEAEKAPRTQPPADKRSMPKLLMCGCQIFEIAQDGTKTCCNRSHMATAEMQTAYITVGITEAFPAKLKELLSQGNNTDNAVPAEDNVFTPKPIVVGLTAQLTMALRPDGWFLLHLVFSNRYLEESRDEDSLVTVGETTEGHLRFGISSKSNEAAKGTLLVGVGAEEGAHATPISGLIREQTVHAICRVKAGETVKLDLGPDHTGKRFELFCTPFEEGTGTWDARKGFIPASNPR
jgi:RNA polymerase sigma factor (sigma-70 family)